MNDPTPDPSTLPPARLTRDQLFARRMRLSGAWLLLSAYEGVPIYLAFMKLSGNPSPEVAFFLALSMCWVPIVGTAAAIMACVFAGYLPWWLAATAFILPKILFMFWARNLERRFER